MKIIEKAIKTLLDRNPFYAHFFLNSKIEYDKYGVPTAAAALTTSGTVMVFSTKYLDSLSLDEVCAVVEHEVDHILFDHTSAMKYDKLLNKDVANIAMDGSINQYIKGLPAGGVTMAMMEKVTKKKLQPLQDWEYYYRELMPHAQKMKGMTGHDDHDADIPGQCKANEGREVLRSSLDKAVKAARGNVPNHIMKTLEGLSAPSVLPWSQLLANFVASAASSSTKNTRKKINRRFGIKQPGKKKKRELTLAFLTDESGSMSDESLQQIGDELCKVTDYATVHWISADCEVNHIEKIKKGKKFARNRYGNGGTAYQPAIDAAMKLKVDAIIYAGDMDSADRPANPGVPFLWVIVGDQEPPADFGQKVRL